MLNISVFVNNECGSYHPEAYLAVKLLFLPDTVSLDSLKLGIGKKYKGEGVTLSKSLVRLYAVLADADDLYVSLFELAVCSCECARLTGASRCIILGIEIYDNLFPRRSERETGSPFLSDRVKFGALSPTFNINYPPLTSFCKFGFSYN